MSGSNPQTPGSADQSPGGRLHTILVDARYEAEHEMAAIACCLPDRPFSADVVEAHSAGEAELLAMLLAMQIAAKARYRRVRFRTDWKNLPQALKGRSRHENPRFRELIARIEARLAENPGWEVAWAPRKKLASAHCFASQVMKIWHAGRLSAPSDELLPIGD